MHIKNKKSIMLVILVVFTLMSLIIGCAGPKPAAGSKDSGQAASTSGEKNSSAENFPTKEVKLIVPVSPGGGMDATARILAKYWEEYLGKRKILVENVPGAEYNSAIFAMLKGKPDGHQVIFLPGVVINQLIGEKQYDLNKFEWIGRVSASHLVTVASKKSGIKSLQDLKNKGNTVVAVTGLSSSQTVAQFLVARELGFKVSPVTHKGATEAILSVIRGDSEWTTSTEVAMIPHVNNGDVVPLFIAGTEKRLPELPSTPTLIELGQPVADKLMGFHRIMATNPGTPANITKALRDSFEKAVKDQRFVDEMKKMNDIPDFLSGEETAALVKESLDLISPNVDYLKSFTKQ